MSRLSLKCPECSHQFTLKSDIDSDTKATCPECEARFAPKPPEKASKRFRDDDEDDPRPSRRKNRKRADDDYDTPPARRNAPMGVKHAGALSAGSILCVIIGIGIYLGVRDGRTTNNNSINTPPANFPRVNPPNFNQPKFNPPVFNQPDLQGLNQPGPRRTNNQGIGNNQGLGQEPPFSPRPPAFPQPGFPMPGSPGG